MGVECRAEMTMSGAYVSRKERMRASPATLAREAGVAGLALAVHLAYAALARSAAAAIAATPPPPPGATGPAGPSTWESPEFIRVLSYIPLMLAVGLLGWIVWERYRKPEAKKSLVDAASELLGGSLSAVACAVGFGTLSAFAVFEAGAVFERVFEKASAAPIVFALGAMLAGATAAAIAAMAFAEDHKTLWAALSAAIVSAAAGRGWTIAASPFPAIVGIVIGAWAGRDVRNPVMASAAREVVWLVAVASLAAIAVSMVVPPERLLG
jgi:hypothetical protein